MGERVKGMRHPYRHSTALPPPAPMELVLEETSGGTVVGVVLWVLGLALALLFGSWVYHRLRSDPPLRAKRIQFSLFRQPHMSAVY